MKIERVEFRGDFLRGVATLVDFSSPDPISEDELTRLRKLVLRLYAARPEWPHAVVELLTAPGYLVDVVAANALENTDDPQITRAWRWWSTVTRHPKFNGWSAVAITAAFAALAITWIRIHYPPAVPVTSESRKGLQPSGGSHSPSPSTTPSRTE